MAFLLAGRKKHPWGKSIGIGRGTIDRIFAGQLPGGETLALIARAENASITWILEGAGSPYLSYLAVDESDFSRAIRAQRDDSWSVAYFLEGYGRCAVILSQPASYEVKSTGGKTTAIDHTAIEVIAGPTYIGIDVDLASLGEVRRLPIDAETIDRLARGSYGTWQLLLADNAICRGAEAVPEVALPAGVAEGGPKPYLDTDSLRSDIDRLPAELRAHLAAIVSAMVAGRS